MVPSQTWHSVHSHRSSSRPAGGQRDGVAEGPLGGVEVAGRQRHQPLAGGAVRLPGDVADARASSRASVQPGRLASRSPWAKAIADSVSSARTRVTGVSSVRSARSANRRPVSRCPRSHQSSHSAQHSRPASSPSPEGQGRLERRLEVALLAAVRRQGVDRLGAPVGRHVALGERRGSSAACRSRASRASSPSPSSPGRTAAPARAGRSAPSGADLHERVLDQALERRQDVPAGHRLGGVEGEAAGEDRRAAGTGAAPAPAGRSSSRGSPHGALARRQVAGAAAGHGRVQPGQQRAGVEHPHLGGGQLERQRDAGQPAAEPATSAAFSVVDGEARVRPPGRARRTAHRRGRRDALRAGRARGTASGCTGCSRSPRSRSAARLVARTDHAGAGLEQLAEAGAASSRCSRLSTTSSMRRVAQRPGDDVGGVEPLDAGQPDRVADGRQHERRVRQRRQRHPATPSGKAGAARRATSRPAASCPRRRRR